jgi:CHASE1-domain containing sensor protein
MECIMRLIILISLLLLSAQSVATVYRWVDENGKVHYSDEQKNNAEAVELNENTQNNMTIDTPTKINVIPTTEASINYTISITSPQEEATVRDNNGAFTVSVSVTPQLPRGVLMTLLVDGIITAPAQASNIFQLTGINRGEHSLVVNAVTQSGKVLASSSPRKIFLHQASVFGPAKKSR